MLTLRDGRRFSIRALHQSDAEAFGAFLASLTPTTRQYFGPLPLTRPEARRVCASLDYRKQLPLVVRPEGSDEIVGYVFLDFGFPANPEDDERPRYDKFGIGLAAGKDCRLAPVVAEKYQDSGLGSRMCRYAIEHARTLGRRYVVLFGGVQARNARAVKMYQRLGFRHAGDFTTVTGNNHDMYLVL